MGDAGSALAREHHRGAIGAVLDDLAVVVEGYVVTPCRPDVVP